MITDTLFVVAMMAFIARGLTRPFVALSGVIWIDLFRPQLMSTSYLYGKPLSLAMTAFFFFSLALNFRKLHKPATNLFLVLMPIFLVWITVTTYYAEFPTAAWLKHDAAFKTILLAYFIPFAIATRREIELFVWVVVASMSFFIFTAGAKSLRGGGGYGVALVNINPGMLWNEGSTLATQAIALIPLLYFAGKLSQLAERFLGLKPLLLGIAFCGLAVLIGTQARTGLVALVALVIVAFGYAKKSRGRLLALVLITPLLAAPFLSSSWIHRMDSIGNATQESSAQGRIAVWRWTLDYVSERPFMGGGFCSYLANAGQLDKYSEFGEVVIHINYGKAFHNIFIEVLGEHGYVGLSLFLAIIVHTLIISRRISRHHQGEEWQKWLARCIFMSTVVYCTGGMFIGVAFYPWIYYMYGLAVALATGLKYIPQPASTACSSPTGGLAAQNPCHRAEYR